MKSIGDKLIIKSLAILLILCATSVVYAQFNDDQFGELGERIFGRGMGVEKDFSKAIVVFRQAGERGDAEAIYKLGMMVESGEGCGADPQYAAKLFEAAAEEEHMGAIFKLGTMYLDGTGVAKDEAKGMQLIEKAAEGDDADAIDFLKNINNG